MALLPGWPLIEDAVSFHDGPTTTPNPNYWVNITPRTINRSTTKRGRQYELDQVQAGEATLSVYNTDGLFDPSNTSGGFYPLILPFRGYRKRAQCPATVNILTASQATAGLTTYDSFGASSSLAAGVLPTWTSGAYSFTTDGAGNYKNTVPSSPTSGIVIQQLTGFSCTPGSPMTASVRVSSTANINLQVAWLGYRTDGTIFAAAGSSSPVTVNTTPVRLTSTYTPPAGVVGLWACLNISSGSAACTLTANQWQVEYASSASTYVTPSAWYPIFSGFVERWPQTWTRNGTYGVSSLECVDAFAWFSQRPLHCPAYHEILNLSPAFAYFLDEPQTATAAIDATANQQPMPLELVQTGGAATFGTSLAGTVPAKGDWSDTHPPLGVGGPVVTFTNSGTGGVSVLNLGQVSAQVGPPSNSAWTRIWAFKAPVGSPAAKGQGMWGAFAPANASGSFSGYTLAVNGSFQGDLQFSINNYATSTFNTISLSNSVSVLDGYWHLAVVTCASDGKTITAYYDGTALTPVTSASDLRVNCSYPGVEYVGAEVYPGQTIQSGFTGDMQLVAGFNTALTSGQVSAVYSAWRYGGSGLGTSTSGTSYQDRLRWLQWNGPQAEDSFTTGQTTAYGPSTDLNSSRDATGVDGLSSLQAVVDTETGAHFVARDGTVTLKARQARYNQATPVVTFGENVAGGEIPYLSASFGYDPTRITNDTQMTQVLTGAVVRATDATSIGLYGDVQLQRDINSTNLLEVIDAGTFVRDRYKNPQQRIETVTVGLSTFTNPAATTAAWLAVLKLELGSRVRVNRRPPGAPTITFDGFVESISWTFDDKGSTSVDLEISSAAGLLYWALDSATYSVLGSTTILGY